MSEFFKALEPIAMSLSFSRRGSIHGLPKTVIELSGKISLTASSAGRVMTASPTQLVARTRIRLTIDLSILWVAITLSSGTFLNTLFDHLEKLSLT